MKAANLPEIPMQEGGGRNEEQKHPQPTMVKFDDGRTPISSLAQQSVKAPEMMSKQTTEDKPHDSPSIDDEAIIAKMLQEELDEEEAHRMQNEGSPPKAFRYNQRIVDDHRQLDQLE